MIKGKEIKYIDLFSGVGGFRLAMERAAAQSRLKPVCVGFSEIDNNALKTYKANFQINSDEFELGDINYLSLKPKKTKDISNFDVLFAGFPCQPFSLMGKEMGFGDTRGTLFFQIANILKSKKPSLFILENVRGLKNHDKGKTLQRILDILTKELKYRVRVDVLNSHDFGVPQTRRRLYLIGTKNKDLYEQIKKLDFSEDQEMPKYRTTWHLLEREVDDRYYLSKKILKTILSHGSGGYYSRSEINRLVARPLTATMHKLHRANQDNYFSDSFILGDFQTKTQTVALAEHPKRIRRITPLEAFRLQGFDDNFVLEAVNVGVSDTQLYRQAGNAITVNVAETVLKTIFKKTNFLDLI